MYKLYQFFMVNMSGIPKPLELPEPKEVQEIRGILERHKERTSNIGPVVSIIESLMKHFETFVERELNDIHRQVEILEPWYQLSIEKEKLEKLEKRFEEISSKLRSLLSNIKEGKVKSMEDLDLDVITDAFQVVDDVEELWSEVERWSIALLRQAVQLKQWIQEIMKGVK
jgi:uncharacterized protein YPO0396